MDDSDQGDNVWLRCLLWRKWVEKKREEAESVCRIYGNARAGTENCMMFVAKY